MGHHRPPFAVHQLVHVKYTRTLSECNTSQSASGIEKHFFVSKQTNPNTYIIYIHSKYSESSVMVILNSPPLPLELQAYQKYERVVGKISIELHFSLLKFSRMIIATFWRYNLHRHYNTHQLKVSTQKLKILTNCGLRAEHICMYRNKEYYGENFFKVIF